jgi:L-amino acid N-acyltransferase YncA
MGIIYKKKIAASSRYEVPVEYGAARWASATPVGAGEWKKWKKQRQNQKATKRVAKSAGRVPGGPADMSST